MQIPKQVMTFGNTWDIHSHAVPEEVVSAPVLRQFQMTADAKVLQLRGERLLLPNLFNANWIRRNRETLADNVVLSVPPALLRYDVNAQETKHWATVINDGLERLCRSEDGFWGLAYLPMHEPELALREIEARGGAPWLGYVIGTSIGDKLLDDSALDPTYEALNEKQALVFVHPLRSADERLSKYYLENLLGNPYETGLAMASLVLSGKLRRYPRIKFCFSHAGGVTPQILGRWQRGYDTQRPGLEGLDTQPYELANQLYVDCVAHDPFALQMSIKMFGLDHVLPGTDNPFPMGQSLAASLNALLEKQREAILYRNFPKLLAECAKLTME